MHEYEKSTYIVVCQIRMHIVDAVVHNSGSDILSGVALCPGRLHIQIQSRLTTVLSDILEIPLIFEVWIVRFGNGRDFGFYREGCQWSVTTFSPSKAALLYCCVDLRELFGEVCVNRMERPEKNTE